MSTVRSVLNVPKQSFKKRVLNTVKKTWKNDALPIITGLSTLALDQLSKFAARLSFERNETMPITDDISIGHLRNTLGVFGQDNRPEFLMDLLSSNSYEALKSTLILGGLGIASHIWRRAISLADKVALSVFSARLVGNLIDRLMFSGGTDIIKIGFIHRYFYNSEPYFNLADATTILW